MTNWQLERQTEKEHYNLFKVHHEQESNYGFNDLNGEELIVRAVYHDVEVYGQHVLRCLFDTGAQVNIISKKLLITMLSEQPNITLDDIRCVPPTRTIVCANESDTSIGMGVRLLICTPGGTPAYSTFCVVDGPFSNHIICGMPALVKLRISMYDEQQPNKNLITDSPRRRPKHAPDEQDQVTCKLENRAKHKADAQPTQDLPMDCLGRPSVMERNFYRTQRKTDVKQKEQTDKVEQTTPRSNLDDVPDNSNNTACFRSVRVTKRTTIMPGQRGQVPTELLGARLSSDSDQTGHDARLFEPNDRFRAQPGIKFASSVDTLVEGQLTHTVEVYNHTDQPYTVRKRSTIGTCTDNSRAALMRGINANLSNNENKLTHCPEWRPNDDQAQAQMMKGDDPDAPWKEHINATDLNFGEHMTKEQISRIRQILLNNAHCVSLGAHDLPVAKGAPMRMDVTGDPIRIRCRKTPIKAEQFVNKMMNTLLRNGLIEPSLGHWAAPITVARKKGGEGWRLCFDFRLLNLVTKTETIHLPLVPDIQRGVHKKGKISTLDMCMAYWQLPMDKASQQYTGFTTTQGTYQWRRVPYGLKNAPIYFTRYMASVLSPMTTMYGVGLHPSIYVASYVDDIIIATSTYEEHYFILNKVLELFAANNIKLGLAKCSFCMSQTPFLGWIVSAEGKMPNPQKTSAISALPAPTTTKKLRSFLGMTNYYATTIEKYAQMAAPLFEALTKKGFIWQKEQQEAFEQLKRAITHDELLHYPDASREFVVTTDASDIAVAGVLEQEDDNGVLRTIGFFSKRLNPAQRCYGTSDKEATAMMMTLKFFRQYLIGGKVIVYTDHKALLTMMQSPRESHRLSRYCIELMEYNLDLRFIKGKENGLADFLSRNPTCHPDDLIMHRGNIYERASAELMADLPRCEMIKCHKQEDTPNVAAVEIVNKTLAAHRSIQEAQDDCPDTRRLRDACRTMEHPEQSMYMLVGDLLTMPDVLGSDELRPYIPPAMRNDVIDQLHAGPMAAHFHAEKMLDLIGQRYAWPSMRADIDKRVAQCVVCMRTMPGQHLRPDLLPFEAERRFEKLGMDVIKLGPSTSGYTYAVVFMCHYARYPIVIPIVDQQAETLIHALITGVIEVHGCPEEIVCDNHPSHASTMFINFCTAANIRLNMSRGYSHRHAGLVERFNRTLIQMIRRTAIGEHDWPAALPWVILMYRTTVCPATGVSPAMLINGRNLRLPSDNQLAQNRAPPLTDFHTHAQATVERIEKAMRVVAHVSKESRADMMNKFRKAHKTSEINIIPGQLVFVQSEGALRQANNRKLMRGQYLGPYRVIKVNAPLLIVEEEGNPTHVTVHMKNCVIAKHPIKPDYGRTRRLRKTQHPLLNNDAPKQIIPPKPADQRVLRPRNTISNCRFDCIADIIKYLPPPDTNKRTKMSTSPPKGQAAEQATEQAASPEMPPPPPMPDLANNDATSADRGYRCTHCHEKTHTKINCPHIRFAEQKALNDLLHARGKPEATQYERDEYHLISQRDMIKSMERVARDLSKGPGAQQVRYGRQQPPPESSADRQDRQARKDFHHAHQQGVGHIGRSGKSRSRSRSRQPRSRRSRSRRSRTRSRSSSEEYDRRTRRRTSRERDDKEDVQVSYNEHNGKSPKRTTKATHRNVRLMTEKEHQKEYDEHEQYCRAEQKKLKDNANTKHKTAEASRAYVEQEWKNKYKKEKERRMRKR